MIISEVGNVSNSMNNGENIILKLLFNLNITREGIYCN